MKNVTTDSCTKNIFLMINGEMKARILDLFELLYKQIDRPEYEVKQNDCKNTNSFLYITSDSARRAIACLLI